MECMKPLSLRVKVNATLATLFVTGAVQFVLGPSSQRSFGDDLIVFACFGLIVATCFIPSEPRTQDD